MKLDGEMKKRPVKRNLAVSKTEKETVSFSVARAIAGFWRATAVARGISLGCLIERTMMKDDGIRSSMEANGITETQRRKPRTGIPAQVNEYINHNGPTAYAVIVDDLQDLVERSEETSVGERRRRVMNAINWLVRSGDLKRDETTDIVSNVGNNGE